MPLPPPEGFEELEVPWSPIDDRLADDTETEQHKRRRGKNLRSVLYATRHATTKWGAALENFKSTWFAIVISTGGLATVLNGPFAYPARWLGILANIFYVFEIVLFVFFMIVMLARWTIYPHVAARRALRDPVELGAYAIPPISPMIIAGLTASQVSTAGWGGHGFTILAYVSGGSVDRVMTPVLFMAPVGLATAGTEAGFITVFSEGMSSRMAVPMLVVGYFAIGVALFTAIISYTMYFHRLFSAGWTGPMERPAIFILIGPCGQLSTAFQLLGESASHYMRLATCKPSSVHPPRYGTFWTQEMTQGLDAASLLFALLLLGFGYLCASIAVYGVVEHVVRRQAKYSLVWWSLVFPSVVLTTAWQELSYSMDSPAFRSLTAASTVMLGVMYSGILGLTLWGAVKGDLMFGQTQVEIEDGLMKKEQDKRDNGQV